MSESVLYFCYVSDGQMLIWLLDCNEERLDGMDVTVYVDGDAKFTKKPSRDYEKVLRISKDENLDCIAYVSFDILEYRDDHELKFSIKYDGVELSAIKTSLDELLEVHKSINKKKSKKE